MDTKPAADATTTGKIDPKQAGANAGGDPSVLHVRVWSPFRVFFDGSASSVSAANLTGPFDILPRHHNFITLVIACDLGLETKDGPLKIRISGGVMHVRKNSVTVFLEV